MPVQAPFLKTHTCVKMDCADIYIFSLMCVVYVLVATLFPVILMTEGNVKHLHNIKLS